MPSPFDGAGDPYRGGSYRGWIAVAVVCLIVIALLWLAYGEALEILPPGVQAS
jgi:hypothetical protein